MTPLRPSNTYAASRSTLGKMSSPETTSAEFDQDERKHPLEEGIEAAERGDTAGLEDILEDIK